MIFTKRAVFLFALIPVIQENNSFLVHFTKIFDYAKMAVIWCIDGFGGGSGMNNQGLTKMRKLGSVAMTVVMSIALIPGIVSPKQVKADFIKNQENTRLGVSQISNPRVPKTKNDEWQGSYVYYGSYNNAPVLYRVLDKHSTSYGGDTLFLDCARYLWYMPFDSRSNKWNGSSCYTMLQGYQSFLSSIEYNAIAKSYIGRHYLNTADREVNSLFYESVPLTGEKIFLLDIEDVLNLNYGYWNEYEIKYGEENLIPNHIKNGDYGTIGWLRTACVGYSYSELAGCIGKDGGRADIGWGHGIAPAFNIDLNNILFSSAYSGTYGKLNTGYKLTIKDPNLALDIYNDQAEMTGRTVTIPYAVSGSNSKLANELSVLITDKPYTESDASILYYDRIPTTFRTNSSREGKGTFTLPSNVSGNWGKSYHVYLLAETINEDITVNPSITDYACEPVEITRPGLNIQFDLTKSGSTDTLSWDYYFALQDMLSLGLINGDDMMSGGQHDFDLDRDGTMDFRFLRDSMKVVLLSSCTATGSWYFYGNAFPKLKEKGYSVISFLLPPPREVEIDLTHGGLTGKYWDISIFGVLGSLNLVGFEYQDGNDYQDVDLDNDGNMDIRTNWMGQMYMERLSTCSVFGKLTFSSSALLNKGYKSITFLLPLPSVSISSAVPAGKNKVKLTWNAVKGAEGYLIYAQKNGQYGYVGMTTKGTTFTDSKALDTDYNYYWVFAYFKNGDKMIPGGCVKYVYAKGVCAAVTNLKASSQKGSVKLSWTASEGAEGYLVYGIRPGGSYGYIGMTTQGTTYTDTKASKTDYTFYWVFPYHKTNGQMIVGGTAKYTYGKAR